MPRLLILSADIGAGHDAAAALLACALRARGAEVTVADGIAAMGRLPHALGRRGAEKILRHAPAVFDVEYWLIQRCAPTRRIAAWLLARLGGRGLERLVAEVAPDAVVSTYPGTTEVLGRLRFAGRVPVPCAAVITDLAALRFCAHPGIDLHLIAHAESRPEVERIAGAGADIRHVRGLSRPEFDAPPVREAHLCGTPVISYGWRVGHIRVNDAAFRRFGLAAVAGGPVQLRTELIRALTGATVRRPAAAAPTAAAAILGLL